MNISKTLIGSLYGSCFSFGTIKGYKMGMDEWDSIKSNNTKLNNSEYAFQVFHTSFVTLVGGMTGPILLSVSPVIIPYYFMVNK